MLGGKESEMDADAMRSLLYAFHFLLSLFCVCTVPNISHRGCQSIYLPRSAVSSEPFIGIYMCLLKREMDPDVYFFFFLFALQMALQKNLLLRLSIIFTTFLNVLFTKYDAGKGRRIFLQNSNTFGDAWATAIMHAIVF